MRYQLFGRLNLLALIAFSLLLGGGDVGVTRSQDAFLLSLGRCKWTRDVEK